MAMYGAFIVSKIEETLLCNFNARAKFGEFLPIGTEDESVLTCFKLLTSMYSKMRGKDFALKLVSKGLALKLATRNAMAAISNACIQKKIEENLKKMKDEMNTIVEDCVNEFKDEL